jgi:hypothetical protein
VRVFTVGHGTRPTGELLDVLDEAGVPSNWVDGGAAKRERRSSAAFAFLPSAATQRG